MDGFYDDVRPLSDEERAQIAKVPLDEAEYLIQTIQKRLPGFRAITINGHLFQNAGATLVQELAFSLASGNEYLADLTSKGLPAGNIADNLQFSFGIGSNYFMEIAKLRAARLLWTAIVEQYQPQNQELQLWDCRERFLLSVEQHPGGDQSYLQR